MLTARPKSKQLQPAISQASRALPQSLIHHTDADRTYYLRSSAQGVLRFFSKRVNELYNSLALTFSLDSVDWKVFHQYVWPTISSGAALVLGAHLTRYASTYQTGTPKNDYFYKFLLGAATLGYCALHRITDKKFTSNAALSAAVAAEVMAITYMYSSVYTGTTLLLDGVCPEEYSLIAGLGTSAILVPSAIALLVQKTQESLVRWQHHHGAQRSDTAMISSGMTPISNMYFQVNRFIASELTVSSRAFQLGLIAHNVRFAEKAVQKFRNLPALLADLAPSTIKKMRVQHDKLEHDYQYNNTVHQVLRFTTHGPIWFKVCRYQLRSGDLVHCDHSIDLECVPLSGELIALQRDALGREFEQILVQQKFSVNLKAQNGEDVWIEHQTKAYLTSPFKKVDLYAVRDGKQAGVLVGDKLNLFGNDNVFIQIKPETNFLLSSDYEKKSVINDIISARKQKSVLSSITGSILMASLLQRDIALIPAETLRLMFILFQTMIPFSEAFLRETVNSRLMKQLNSVLGENPLDTIDALRVVDLCNALGGYYQDRFPKGVAIISDKTGTLTTTKMDVLGIWTTGMQPGVQDVLKEQGELLLPSEKQWLDIFHVFCAAFTNNKKELEPEEHAILEVFKSLLDNPDCLEVTVFGTNHFKKVISSKENNKEIETFQLGLYSSFGGRFTLVEEGSSRYLVFCGVPKAQAFAHTSLLRAYTAMHSRKAVLSRDWCLARAVVSSADFIYLKDCFEQGNKQQIEAFLLHNIKLLNALHYYGTFIIDNPVKTGAEHFIGQCRHVGVPVFVATGDTLKAAENIAKVLCSEHAQKIITIRPDSAAEVVLGWLEEGYSSSQSTVIFAGINPTILTYFQQLMRRDKDKRPVVIFAEMNTEGKGVLARHLRDAHYFVVANGDGSNDVMMMKNANMVIAYRGDDGSFAPGVGDLVNISEDQVQRLFDSQKSFYELCDFHQPNSLLVQKFAPLANSQEKPTMALALKSGKMNFDLARTLGFDVRDMPNQHWYSVVYDLLWLWIAIYEINESADLPMDNCNINASLLISSTMAISLVIGVVQSVVNYGLFGESTNITSMMLMLSLLPLILKSIFCAFEQVQNDLYPKFVESKTVEREDVVRSNQSFWRSARSFFTKEPVKQEEQVSMMLKKE